MKSQVLLIAMLVCGFAQGCFKHSERRDYFELAELQADFQGASEIELEIETGPGQTRTCQITATANKARILPLLDGRLERLPHEAAPSIWGKAILKIRKKSSSGSGYDYVLATIDDDVFLGMPGMGRADEFDFYGKVKSDRLYTFLTTLCDSAAGGAIDSMEAR